MQQLTWLFLTFGDHSGWRYQGQTLTKFLANSIQPVQKVTDYSQISVGYNISASGQLSLVRPGDITSAVQSGCYCDFQFQCNCFSVELQ